LIIIVTSEQDEVSKRLHPKIIEELKLRIIEDRARYQMYGLEDTYLIHFTNKDLIYTDDVEDIIESKKLNVKLLLYVSRHEMANPKPMFTVHVSGNWGGNTFGGKPEKVSLSHPYATSQLFKVLNKYVVEERLNEYYSCEIEATHHGPSIETIPVLFLELGSSVNEWSDIKALNLMLNVIKDFCQNFDKYLSTSNGPVTLSIGDLHYSTLKNEVLDGKISISHIIPKYININDRVLEMAMARSILKVERAIVHWKAIGRDVRSLVLNFLHQRNIEIIKKR